MKFASSTNVDVKKNIFVFILLSFILFFLDRSDNKYLTNVRFIVNDTIIYSSLIIKSPFSFVIETSKNITNFFQKKDSSVDKNKLINLKNKLETLKNENIALNLQIENFKKINNEEIYKYETVQAKVLLYKSNILHETIIINKGQNDGIKAGDPIIKNNILVGKILKTNFNSSHGILITNINSRIPVRIGKKNYKAIVVGNPKSDLKNKLETLKNENIALNLQIENFKKINNEEIYKYETVQAKVLLYKSNILHETIIINKGQNDGIKAGDPIIKNNILVGKILKTNFNSSHGILITNINSRIPVRIGKKNYKAIVVGNPKSERQLNLEFLPKEYTFEDGDIIYTTSIDNIMPDGILVGKIKLRDDKNFEAKPLYDFSQLDYLTVVRFSK